MRTMGVVGAFVILVAVGGYFVFAGPRHAGGRAAGPAGGVASGAMERGRPFGTFDANMSGVCQFACAVSEPFEATDVTLQPGVSDGALTQCPVSGVVFAVDHGRPRVTIATGEYVLCCDGCAKKFRKSPGRFVSL